MPAPPTDRIKSVGQLFRKPRHRRVFRSRLVLEAPGALRALLWVSHRVHAHGVSFYRGSPLYSLVKWLVEMDCIGVASQVGKFIDRSKGMVNEARKVFKRVSLVCDKELHVSTVETPGDGTFVDLREFIPSLGAYGRGVTFPQRHFPEIMAGMDEAYKDLGYEPGLDEDQSMEYQRMGGGDDE
ncbi:hypothetical protein [Streptomyces mirabilis]|uniref:hypothetical protein n=1 Tax=Streptomyces mirabilis TaxID=68239 RepID=UPI0036BB084D